MRQFLGKTPMLAHTLVRHPAKARAMREEVVEAQAARLYPIFPQWAWVSFDVHAAEDVPAALALLRRSYDRMKSEGTL